MALLGISAVVLAAAFVLSGRTPTPVSPGDIATPGATPTLTKEEEIVIEMQHINPHNVSSPDECGEISEAGFECSVPQSAERITRPEWEELFPQTEFFLVKYDSYIGDHGPLQRNWLVVEQNGQRYSVKTFDHLLEVNDITITDENRELVAKAVALMMLPDYLEEDVQFSDWSEADRHAILDWHYNYTLVAWTKIQGLKIQWWFMFENNHLRLSDGGVRERQVGNYIDVPFTKLSPPSSSNPFLYSWER